LNETVVPIAKFLVVEEDRYAFVHSWSLRMVNDWLR
jgi:hypothetical protein